MRISARACTGSDGRRILPEELGLGECKIDQTFYRERVDVWEYDMGWWWIREKKLGDLLDDTKFSLIASALIAHYNCDVNTIVRARRAPGMCEIETKTMKFRALGYKVFKKPL